MVLRVCANGPSLLPNDSLPAGQSAHQSLQIDPSEYYVVRSSISVVVNESVNSTGEFEGE